MSLHKVFNVDDSVAFSPMPSTDTLAYIMREFDLVMAVVEAHELEYDPSVLQGRAEFIHIPVPDYAWPSLWQLYRAARITTRAAREGKRVLIHCMGGRGRSATLTAGYLIYRYGFSARHAVEILRSIRRGAVETAGQLGVLRGLEATLMLGDERLQSLYSDRRAGEALRLGGQLAEALKNSGLGSMWLAYSLVSAVAETLQGSETHSNRVEVIAEKVLGALDSSEKVASVDLESDDGSYRLIVVCTGSAEYCESFAEDIARAISEVLYINVEAKTMYE